MKCRREPPRILPKITCIKLNQGNNITIAQENLREKNREERVFWQHNHAPKNDEKMTGGASLLQLERFQTHSQIKGPKHRSKLQLSSTLRSRFVDFANHPPIISKGASSNQWSKRQIHVIMKLNPQIQGFHDSSGPSFDSNFYFYFLIFYFLFSIFQSFILYLLF